MGDERGHHCLACGKAITWRFAICAACEEIYGNTAAEWPSWLVFMWRDVAKQRRRAKIISVREITASDLSMRLAVEFQDNATEEVV